MIDDYDKAMALLEKIKAHLPMPVYPTPSLRKLMREEGLPCGSEEEFLVTDTIYGGDDGGICCSFSPNSDPERMFVVSLTHLRVAEDHPLARSILIYQKRRVARLPMSEEQPRPALKKKKRGFLR